MAVIGVNNHESVTVSNTAVGITTTVAEGFKPAAAVITVETASIRYCVDGTTATSSVGHRADPGDVIELTDRGEVANFSAIRKDGTDATIKVTTGVDWRPG
jgi:hypothetical protein